MPRSTPNRLAAACALVIAVSLTLVPAAFAKGFSVDLHVVGKGGKSLAERPVSTATTSVKTSPKAECFGKGSGGDGAKVSIEGNTAMGVLARASLSTPAISPLLISNHFDFGLALCGIGKSVASSKLSWYLKIDHKSQSVGGDQAKVKAGDEVLWALAPYPYPDDLALQAPAKVSAGMPFTVRAFSYDEKGKRKPAAGVKIVGASGTTGSDGKATVTLSKPGLLGASKSGLIPAARVAVCVGGKCPAGH
jgi:hypothetical protein